MRQPQPCAGHREAARGEAAASGVPVVHDDRRRARVGVTGGREPPDVPPVARREQREHGDGRVLGGVQGTGHVGVRDPRLRQHLRWHGPPGAAGAEGARGQVERHLAEHLAGDQPTAQERHDLGGHLHLAVMKLHRAPAPRAEHLAEGERAGLAGERGVVDERHPREGDVGVEVEPRDDVRDALVHVDRALVHARVGGAGVDRAEQPAGDLLHDAHHRARPAQVGQGAGALGAGPVPARGPSAQPSLGDEVVDEPPGARAEAGQVLGPQRQLGRGREQLGAQHDGVVDVERGHLQRRGDEGVGMLDEVVVERVVTGHEHGEGLAPRSHRSPHLLPPRGPAPGPAGHHHRVEAVHVDAELQRRGGGHRAQPAVAQPSLEVAPLLGQQAGAVGRDLVGEPRGGLVEALARPLRHRLGAAAGPREDDRARACHDEVGHQLGRLRGRAASYRGAVLAEQPDDRRLPQQDPPRGPGRAVVVDGDDGLADQAGCRETGLRGGRRGEHDDRLRPVVAGHAQQPAQHGGHVRAEQPAVGVALVDDDVAQPAQERRPHLVAGQQRMVQQVGVGQHDGGVSPGPRALVGRGVAVVRGGPHAGDRELAQRPPLVVGQGLGG